MRKLEKYYSLLFPYRDRTVSNTCLRTAGYDSFLSLMWGQLPPLLGDREEEADSRYVLVHCIMYHCSKGLKKD